MIPLSKPISVATKSTSANTDRSGSISLTPPSTGPFSKLFSSSDVGASGGQGFKGKGDSAQSNALSGEITVTIAKVLGNGTMLAGFRFRALPG